MARKTDSGWRDELIGQRHEYYGFAAPAPGMTLPMVEYDRGAAVGLIDYRRAGEPLPKGPDVAAAFRAFAKVRADRDGSQLPFLTVAYDPRDWTMRVFPHNGAAQLLVGIGWQTMTEREYARILYMMRNQPLPDLSRYGVEWNTATTPHSAVAGITVPAESWPGEHLSRRRRAYEPLIPVPFRQRIPCMDVDFAVVDVDERVSLVVDYKRRGAAGPLPTGDFNLKALASMRTGDTPVAAFVAEYAPRKPLWSYRVYPLNSSASSLLSYALGHTGADVKQLADAIMGTGWLDLAEGQWRDVLRCARDV